MKIYYTCEHCGKRFYTAEQAEACEKKHSEEEAKRKALKEQREERENEIKELVKKFYEDYGTNPTLPLFGVFDMATLLRRW